MRTSICVIAFSSLLVVSFSACSSVLAQHRQATKTTGEADPAADPDADVGSHDEEAGAAAIRRQMRQFGAQLQAKRFDEAEMTLRGAEQRVVAANELTRGHPDFDDLAREVRVARPRLQEAIEADRLARVLAAIDDIIRRGERAMEQGRAFGAMQAAHSPTPEDLEGIHEIEHTLDDLTASGAQYNDAPRYVAHVQKRDAERAALAALAQKVERQLAARQAVVPLIEAGVAAAYVAQKATDTAAQAQALQEAATSFAGCARALRAMSIQAGYDPALVLDTKLGHLSAVQTEQACDGTALQAAGRARHLRWQGAVQAQVLDIKKTKDALQFANDANTAVATNGLFAEALRACQDNPALMEGQPGYVAEQRFFTPFGELNVRALALRCGKEAIRADQEAVNLRWRLEAQEVVERLKRTQSMLNEAVRSEDPSRKSAAYTTALGGLQECVAQAADVLRKPGATPGMQFESAWGTLSLEALEKQCRDQIGRAEQGLQQALKNAEAKGFLSQCKGDEIAVVQRDGVPTRIEVVPQGRIFIYVPDDGHGETERIAFNQEGTRVDFSVDYKTQVQQLVAKIADLLPDAHGTGQTAAKASDQVLSLLQTCSAGSVTERHVGFDPKAEFNTPFGMLHGAPLSRACGAEADKLRARRATVEWHTRLEALAASVRDGTTLMQGLQANLDPHARADKATKGVRMFGECVERARALAGDPAADLKFAIVAFGAKVKASALVGACEKARSRAKVVVSQAELALAKEAFLKSCRADERVVGEREGLPHKILPTGSGRTFVYANKKRFVFDAFGKRLAEKKPTSFK